MPACDGDWWKVGRLPVVLGRKNGTKVVGVVGWWAMEGLTRPLLQATAGLAIIAGLPQLLRLPPPVRYSSTRFSTNPFPLDSTARQENRHGGEHDAPIYFWVILPRSTLGIISLNCRRNRPRHMRQPVHLLRIALVTSRLRLRTEEVGHTQSHLSLVPPPLVAASAGPVCLSPAAPQPPEFLASSINHTAWR